MPKEKEFYVVCILCSEGCSMTEKIYNKKGAEERAEALAIDNPGVNVFILEPMVKVCNKPKIEREFIY